METMNTQTRLRLAFASLCSLLAMAASAWIYFQRDSLIEWKWAEAHGQFVTTPDAELRVAARDYAEAGHPGQVCIEKWLGKDERFIYLGLGCATFRRHLGELHVVGDPNFRPTRLRYSGDKVSELEQPRPEAFTNGLRRLFPQQAAQRLKAEISQQEYQARGYARMEERGMPSLGE
jgi:hypothetical protein